tara:strand:+ start:4979 stop:5434 length:456 start_codon:yes stop_codon:yes gene_type:complete
MATGMTPALSPETAERYRLVIDHRIAGATFQQIADRVGYASRSGAKEAYDAALRWWGTESVNGLRTIEGERLEQLWRRTMQQLAVDRDDDDELSAGEFVLLINAAVKISGRRSGLMGLDAPKQIEVAGADGGAIRTDVGDILRERLRQLEL